MAAKLHNYTSIADIQDFWTTEIAPQYFDFNDTNLYKIGNLGYDTEVMSTVTADVFNAINIAKREFYSSTAENLSSFYKLAGTFGVKVPLTIPSTCKSAIFLQEKDIISNSKLTDGIYSFTLDNTMSIMADSIPFTIDYPIKIMAKYMNGAYSYTTYYDTTKKNSMSSIASKYIQNKTIMIEGRRYLVLSLNIKQYVMTNNTEVITKNSDIDTVSAIFQYDGNLAGFDIFYTSDPGTSAEIYIPAYTSYEITPASAYCIYEYLPDNKIRITFPKNSYFSPKLNGEVRCCIFTSKGAEGNFDEFNGNLICVPNSENYLYNNALIIRGATNGAAKGGKDRASEDDFIREIRQKNCTNGTITNSADLQIYFNQVLSDSAVRGEVAKSRDDFSKRLYTVFILLKDAYDNIIPTNTYDLIIRKNSFDVFENGRGVIKPGKIFEYRPGDETVQLSTLKMTDNLDIYDSDATKKFLFSNPFLISVSVETGIVGYYGNSIAETKTLEYSFVEDRSFYQFICLGLSIKRNPIAGESFYTFTAKISASSVIDNKLIITKPNEATDVIRAKHDGRVIATYFENGAVWCKVEYYTDIVAEQSEVIQISTYSVLNPTTQNFDYFIGNTMQFSMLDTFVQGDILAKKKVTDLGKIRTNIDFNGTFLANKLYTPMYVEEYDSEKDIYTIRGYISTNDFISLNQTMILDHGIYNIDGTPNNYVSTPMGDITCILSLFYKNDDVNYTHEYSKCEFFKNYTLTNKYSTSADNSVDLIKCIDFIRSGLTFIDTTVHPIGDGEDANVDNYLMRLSAMTIVKSNWLKNVNNFDYLINKIYASYEVLFAAYFELENQYGIEIKFFNTYGTSKRYMIGTYDNMIPLDSINCTMSIGVEVSAMTITSVFIEKYRAYLKNTIENLNDLNNNGKSLYILDLLSESKKEFPEIIHLEYYGFNNMSHGAQIITPKALPSTTSEVQTYVPEFVNIYSVYQNDVNIPMISIKILNDTIV